MKCIQQSVTRLETARFRRSSFIASRRAVSRSQSRIPYLLRIRGEALTQLHEWEAAQVALHAAQDEDWFQFDLLSTGAAGNQVRVDFLNNQGNLDLELYQAGVRIAASATTPISRRSAWPAWLPSFMRCAHSARPTPRTS